MRGEGWAAGEGTHTVDMKNLRQNNVIVHKIGIVKNQPKITPKNHQKIPVMKLFTKSISYIVTLQNFIKQNTPK